MKIYRIAAALMLPAFFWFFHRGVLSAHLGPDEPMNLYTYWAPPLWKTMLANLAFWSRFLRPMAAIYYVPLYRAFGLNAVPYNVIRNVILLLNVALFYQLAMCVSRSRWVALLASLPVAYHAALGFLAWGGAFIYDILCGTFYFSALLYYMRRRKAGQLGFREVCIFLALYICALDSKEMAVTLPVLVLAYELLFHELARDLRSLAIQLLPSLIAGVLTLVYIVGKTGSGSLTDLESYRPVFTWARFSEFSVHSLNQLFYVEDFTMRGVLAVWTALLLLGLLRFRDPRWMFLWIWIMAAPLPMAFLQLRGGPQLYLVLPGWSLAAALVCRSLLRRLAWVWKALGVPLKAAMAAGLLGCAAAYAQQTWIYDRFLHDGYRDNGKFTLEIIEQLKALQVRPKPGSRIVFLTDPFPGLYDMQTIASLVWNDHSLHIELQHQIQFSQAELDKQDYLFDFDQGRLRIRKSPL